MLKALGANNIVIASLEMAVAGEKLKIMVHKNMLWTFPAIKPSSEINAELEGMRAVTL